MNRRGFLQGMLGGILAAATPPAIAKIENLMRMRPTASGLLAPSTELAAVDLGTAETSRLCITGLRNSGMQVGDVIRLHGRNFLVTALSTTDLHSGLISHQVIADEVKQLGKETFYPRSHILQPGDREWSIRGKHWEMTTGDEDGK